MHRSTWYTRFTQLKLFQMKKIMLLVAVMAIAAASKAASDTVIVKAGTDKYVTINGQNFPRGYLMTQYTYRSSDSLLGIMYANTRTYLIAPIVNRKFQYGDTANKQAFNMLTLRSWMNANFENK